MKLISLIGKHYGMLLIVGRAANEKSLTSSRSWTRWECLCECGQTKIILGDGLRAGQVSCGCTKSLPYGFAPSLNVLDWYKQNAKSRGLAWDISDTKFMDLIKDDCHYCGFSLPILRPDLQEFAYNGVDRQDNYRSYVDDNVVTCCKTCNHAKHTMGHEEFMTWVARIAQYQTQKATLSCSFSREVQQVS